MEFQGFKLDTFQEQAIVALNAGNSVLVAAPTGSGKTLVAEYAISKEFSSGNKVIYTAPIKALSNQKYHDFCNEYGKDRVGLITGDVVINPEADILVMTTEVYRNMVVSHDAIITSIRYVVFDEIHYISDIERGTAWEEAIIFSPAKVRFVCLSATVPNAQELADWISEIKQHEVVVVRNNHRAVPLKQMFYHRNRGLLLEEDADFIFKKTTKAFRSRRRLQDREKPVPHVDVVDELQEKDMLPCIFFLFSRKECEKKAEELARKTNLGVVHAPWDELPESVRNLESTRKMRRALSKGVAFHHAGILPAVKHLVESLFSSGKIKVLYTTETFAVGVNMPARTVLMQSLRKYDGIAVRNLTTREYAQMSGRAGRRGIDKEGNAIIVVEQDFNPLAVQKVLGEDTQSVESQFKLSFNTTLNLLKRYTEKDIPNILAQTLWSYQTKKKKGSIERQFANKMRLLRKKKFLDNSNTLTIKGEFASRVYTDELVLAEVFSQGTSLDAYALLLLFAVLVHENKRGEKFNRCSVDETQRQLRQLLIVIDYYDRRWRNIGKMTALIKPCVDGESFVDILNYSSLTEGDLSRLLTQVIDRVRQVKKASPLKEVRQKMDECLTIMQHCLADIDLL